MDSTEAVYLTEAANDVRDRHAPNEYGQCIADHETWPCAAELLAELVVTRATLATLDAARTADPGGLDGWEGPEGATMVVQMRGGRWTPRSAPMGANLDEYAEVEAKANHVRLNRSRIASALAPSPTAPDPNEVVGGRRGGARQGTFYTPSPTAPATHIWTIDDGHEYEWCRVCLTVRQRNGSSDEKPCKGPARIGLRAPSPTAPERTGLDQPFVCMACGSGFNGSVYVHQNTAGHDVASRTICQTCGCIDHHVRDCAAPASQEPGS